MNKKLIIEKALEPFMREVDGHRVLDISPKLAAEILIETIDYRCASGETAKLLERIAKLEGEMEAIKENANS